MVSAFISYSSKDVDIAAQLHTHLEAKGIQIWRDRTRLKGGDFWDSEIEKALSNPSIKNVIVLVSVNSMNSEMVKNEIEYAAQRGKNLIPVIISDFRHRLLRLIRRNEIDLRNRYDSGLQELLNTLIQLNDIDNEPVKPPVVTKPLDFKLTEQQISAAHDERRLVRLIAAPGTGKSLVIEERVRWLLESGVNSKEIAVVSFTRAASRDLKKRIVRYCTHKGIADSDNVNVSTLHSLAMRVLRKAGKLHYPASPKVLDKWETENIFDTEFSETKRDRSKPALQGLTRSRAGEVRGAVEAYWNTGKWDHPSYIPPDNPVSDLEIETFLQFHQPATQTYSCVLPGEIVKKCVDSIDAGTLEPARILELSHFIIDEYQDLNYVDQQFIDEFIKSGCNVFIAGDDDQSIYSFRYAYPTGIQDFADKHNEYSEVGNHTLTECFRCTPDILNTGWSLIKGHESPNRIPKSVVSFCEYGSYSVRGIVNRWKFKSEQAEFEAIANSCKALIEQGVKPRNILILISSRNALLAGSPSTLQQKFDDVELEVEMPTGKHFIDDASGRFVLSVLRIACDLDLEDYVAHRTLLGLLKGIGPKAINGIRDKVVNHTLNYMDLFYNPLPDGIFTSGEIRALKKARDVCEAISGWHSDDIISSRIADIVALMNESINQPEIAQWEVLVAPLPSDMNIGELKTFISTDNSEQQENILRDVYTRLELDVPKEGLLPQQVRIMTMHGAKGLNADVVIVPGLEEDILPGAKRSRYTGLVQEAARQLYVSITRARHCVMLTYAQSRLKHGQRDFNRSASRYCDFLNGQFTNRETSLSEAEAQAIIQTGNLYHESLTERQSTLDQ